MQEIQLLRQDMSLKWKIKLCWDKELYARTNKFLYAIEAAIDETRINCNQAGYETLYVNNTEVKLTLDIGAEMKVISSINIRR